jgi:hypothetical protein
VEIQQKGMDDVKDHGGLVNGFQLQNENAKPARFVVLG